MLMTIAIHPTMIGKFMPVSLGERWIRAGEKKTPASAALLL